jgi:flagellar hook-associated protein 3 FlgL
MSGSITAGGLYTDYGVLGAVVTDSEVARANLDTLTEQAGDGLVSSSYAGLGARASLSLSLTPAIANYTTWQNNISVLGGQLQLTQTTLTSIESIASSLYADTENLDGVDPAEIDDTALQARTALEQVAGLLDTTDGGSYIFAGQDSSNPPIPNPNAILSSGFATQIQAAVAGLASTGSAAVIASTLATASSNAAGTSPFSAALSQPAAAVNALQISVQTGDGVRVSTGILASANASVVSQGTSTTGSYMRDILRALATLSSLSSSQLNTPGFQDVVSDVRTSLGNAIDALNEDAGVLGNTQAALNTSQTQLQDTADSLTIQLGDVQNVDMTQTLSNLTAAQTQLQASYQLINGLQSLSLVKYLTG